MADFNRRPVGSSSGASRPPPRRIGAVRCLVVDDSGFFRRRIEEILNADPGIEVVGLAVDGRDAIQKAQQLKPDVITMDIEMPVMDGITAVRRIMSDSPVPILMFSSLTHEGAKATLNALEAGAMDFLPKRFEEISKDQAEAKRLLCQRVRGLARKPVQRAPSRAGARTTAATPSPGVEPAPAGRADRRRIDFRAADYDLLAIGTSTGGPVALQEVLKALPANFPLPILLIQHMPASFTPAFAERLDRLCAIRVKEAADGEVLEKGMALLAPGGMQMILDRKGEVTRVRVVESPPDQHYRPSVDIAFGSAARVFPGKTLAIVLTGMGADGREGAQRIKRGGGNVWAQDEASCVVYGMPAAVAGFADRVLPLSRIGPGLAGRG